ncbi:hypothetical protein BN13_240027 [Nostocoides jenkinsii Ben 74]|uniref:Uncharacterized protein n=1 Tax=Nostocoides jenkinsii Ben 74 TaxID=1193518 RepID=A0A077MAR7_9MICO|nr:hypothetical protein BN13_240027 [Tetrasphaera jenkinsii Ben 74]
MGPVGAWGQVGLSWVG